MDPVSSRAMIYLGGGVMVECDVTQDRLSSIKIRVTDGKYSYSHNHQMITAQMLYYYATTSPLCYLTASDWDFSDSSTLCSEFKTTKCQMTPLHVHRLLQNKNYVTK